MFSQSTQSHDAMLTITFIRSSATQQLFIAKLLL